MKEKRFAVVFSGSIKPQLSRETVVSNLILELGISDAKARALLDSPGLLLKRFDSQSDAQRLVDRLERAGVVGHLQRHQGVGLAATATNSESSLFHMVGDRPPHAGNQSVLYQRRKG